MPFVHDYWEEVFLITGDLICGSDANGRAENSSKVPHIACGPWGLSRAIHIEDGLLIYSRHITAPRSER